MLVCTSWLTCVINYAVIKKNVANLVILPIKISITYFGRKNNEW
jgi:hypothetical protein